MISRRVGAPWPKGYLPILILCLWQAALCSLSFADPTNTWNSVNQRAKAIGTRKAIWQELKKLSPALLIESGEGFFLSGANRDMDDGGAILANAILSYHSQKTNPDATAAAIAQALSTSEAQGWLKQCVMWLENSDHFLDVSPAAMHSIAVAATESILGRTKQSMTGREGVVTAIREDTFVLCLSDSDFEAVLNACQAVLAEDSDVTASDRMRALCKQYVAYARQGETERTGWGAHVRKLRAKRNRETP